LALTRSRFAAKKLPALLLALAASTAGLPATAEFAGNSQWQTSNAPAVPSDAEAAAQALRLARQAVSATPESADAHMRLGDALRRSGRNREAAQEYMAAAHLQHDLYVAYHQISVTCDDQHILDDAIETLNHEQDKNPRELMLRIALSELLEKRKKYHAAAKTLIDLQYANAVPPKYVPRVETRIHYLLTKAKEAQQREMDQPVATDEELDVVPSPLPDSSLRKPLTASKIKDSKELKGMGHVPLLP
jgi:tetratricopeptide (TPR) repeat protein